MQITLVQGLLIALLVFICAIDKHMETFMWFRPLVVAFFTGIILGDVQLGMQAGAVAELSYLGLLTVGGTVPPDPLFAGLMTTVLAYTTGCDVNTALGLAVPFALIGQWINTGTNTFYAGFLPKVDKCAAAGDEKALPRSCIPAGSCMPPCLPLPRSCPPTHCRAVFPLSWQPSRHGLSTALRLPVV